MTQRQAEILQAIIETYAKTAEPVGSLNLAEQFNMSSATIRAEMAALESAGLIYQPHISAGRVPTDKGYRHYVNAMEDVRTDGRTSQAIAKRVASAGEIDRAIKIATDSLVELTRNLGWATLSEGLYMRGMASLFGQPELADPRQAFEAARLVDSLDEWIQEAHPADRVSLYIGRENPIGRSSGMSLVVARFASPHSDNSYLGMIGPTRQDYPRLLGLVDYTSRMLEEAVNA